MFETFYAADLGTSSNFFIFFPKGKISWPWDMKWRRFP